MDKLILGIVNCEQSSQVKGAFLEKIAISASSDLNKSSCYGVMKACLQILYPEVENGDGLKDALVTDRVERVLISFVENKLNFALEFIQELLCSNRLKDFSDLWTKCQNIRMLQYLLNVVRGVTATGHTDFKVNVKRYLLQEFFQVDNLCLLSTFSEVFLQNPELVLDNCSHDEHTQFIQFVVKIVAKGTPTSSKADKSSNASYMTSISEFFKKCVDTDAILMKFAASLIFKEISNHVYKPCINLATLLAHLKYDVLHTSLEEVLITVPDVAVACILIQLLDWFSLCSQDNDIQSWIMFIIKFLASHEKYNILDPVIVTKVNQVCEMIYNSSVRTQAVTVLAYMLMSCAKNPNPFHKVLVDFPVVLSHLRGDGSKSASQTHQILSELIYTLMYKFPGYSELYEPLNTALQGHLKPDIQTMNKWLSNFNTSEANVSVITMEHSQTVETGLRNLGNTCYMNSIIQALFNLQHVKRKMLSMNYRLIMQPVSLNLQNLFAYLHLSKRSSVEPRDFLSVSRPGWFQSGSQQDCSEYLKHLLDRLHQEDQDTDKIDSVFNGEINATVECLHCHSCSHQKEVFNDLPLSFRNTDSDVVGGTSLKGGDSSDILDTTKKVTFQLDENSKDTVKSTLESGPSIITPDIATPQNSGLSVVDLINNYFLPELLKDSNQYFCDVCSSLQDAYKSMKISKFPKYLIITLKRFTYNVLTKKRSKILDIVQYPPVFSVCNGCESCYEAERTSENTVLAFTTDTNCQSSKTYRISSVIVHSGLTSDSGHYYTYSCRYEGDKYNWYISNDEEVRLVSSDCILSLASNKSCDTPYVCIYEECEPDEVLTISLSERLESMVSSDNDAFLQEKITKSKKSNAVPIRNTYESKSKDDDDEDDSNGSRGPCSSGGGNSWGGARFVC